MNTVNFDMNNSNMNMTKSIKCLDLTWQKWVTVSRQSVHVPESTHKNAASSCYYMHQSVF